MWGQKSRGPRGRQRWRSLGGVSCCASRAVSRRLLMHKVAFLRIFFTSVVLLLLLLFLGPAKRSRCREDTRAFAAALYDDYGASEMQHFSSVFFLHLRLSGFSLFSFFCSTLSRVFVFFQPPAALLFPSLTSTQAPLPARQRHNMHVDHLYIYLFKHSYLCPSVQNNSSCAGERLFIKLRCAVAA